MLAKEMTCEEYREQLREWREDGGRHSDEVRTNLNQTYFRKSTIFCTVSETFQNLFTFEDRNLVKMGVGSVKAEQSAQ